MNKVINIKHSPLIKTRSQSKNNNSTNSPKNSLSKNVTPTSQKITTSIKNVKKGNSRKENIIISKENKSVSCNKSEENPKLLIDNNSLIKENTILKKRA